MITTNYLTNDVILVQALYSLDLSIQVAYTLQLLVIVKTKGLGITVKLKPSSP